MNSFLPKGYEPPAQSGGRYLKITKNSEARVRIVSPTPILGWEYWTDDNKPRRLRERPTTMPSDVRMGEDGNPEKLRHFWAMAVFDYADSVVKVWEVTQATIQRTVADLAGDEDWGHPSGYDLKIKRDDSTGRTTYSVAPVPHKPLSAEAKRIVAETSVNLDALFNGDDPFAAKPPAAPSAQPEPAIPDQPETTAPPAGPMTPAQLRTWLREAAVRFANDAPLPEGWRKAITGQLSKLTGNGDNRHAFTRWCFDVESTNGLTNGQWHALYSWLDIKQADDQKWYPSDLAVAEIKLAMAALAEAPEPF